MKRLQAYRVRLYPTEDQRILLAKTFGCCRLLYNLALEQRETYWRCGRRINYGSWAGELKALKAEIPFIKEPRTTASSRR